MAKMTWEERMLTLDLNEYDGIHDFAEIAADRAEELEDDDLADDIRDRAKEMQDAADELQDTMNRLDDLEKES